MERIAFLALSLCIRGTVALAQQDPVKAEVVEGWRMADGTQVTGLRLTLAPGWKTYWRAPGDAGIPPQFDWSGSRNVGAVKVSWPTPTVFDQNGMRSVGYEDQVILPLHVTPRSDGKPVEMDLSLDIGICRDICIPATLHVSATLQASGGAPAPSIAAALADRPYSAVEAGGGEATCRVKPISGGLEVSASFDLPHTGGQEHVVIEPGRDDIWVSEADTSRSGNRLTATADLVPVSGSALTLDRSALRITVLGRDRAVELLGCKAG